MMLAPRQMACGLLVLLAVLLGVCGCARGMVPAVGVQPGRPVQEALGLGELVGGKACGGEGSLVGEVVNGITGGVSHAAGCAGEAVAGSAAGAVGNGILNVVAEWATRRGDAGHGVRRGGDDEDEYAAVAVGVV